MVWWFIGGGGVRVGLREGERERGRLLLGVVRRKYYVLFFL